MNSTSVELSRQVSAPRRSGRRAGESGTREAIALAARRGFAELGYDRTSIRSIAAEAGVDPALVGHFFGSKQRLFVAAMELPFTAADILPRILEGERAGAGERLARFAVAQLDDPHARRVLTGMVRAAASEPEAAQMVRELLTERILLPVARGLGADDAELRASLAGSQMIGLVMARHIIGIEPLAARPGDRLVRALAPTLQRYLVEPL
jgi:AcrR family transcriptional regulator